MEEYILDEHAFEYYAEKMNEKMNNFFIKGIGCCKSCGASYSGKAKCEYCGRNFFITNILTEARKRKET